MTQCIMCNIGQKAEKALFAYGSGIPAVRGPLTPNTSAGYYSTPGTGRGDEPPFMPKTHCGVGFILFRLAISEFESTM
jgi:hypothetical protein